MAAPPLAHVRQERLRHRQRAEHIRRELRLCLVGADLLDRAECTVASIVDQHIHAAKVRNRCVSNSAHLRRVGYVERQRSRSPWKSILEFLYMLLLARSRNHALALRQHGLGQRAAKPGRAASNKPDPIYIRIHLNPPLWLLWQQLLEEHRAAVARQIEQLDEYAAAIDAKIAICSARIEQIVEV